MIGAKNNNNYCPMYDTIWINVQALEAGKRDDALRLTEKNCGDINFVNSVAQRDGNIDIERFEYRYHKQPREGATLLHYAVLYNHVKMIKILIQHNAG